MGGPRMPVRETREYAIHICTYEGLGLATHRLRAVDVRRVDAILDRRQPGVVDLARERRRGALVSVKEGL